MVVALLLCVLIYCILFYGHGIIEHSKEAYSLTAGTQLNLFSAVFYLPHLGVFLFLFVLSISLMPANTIIYLERNICSFSCVYALHK